MTLTSLGAAAPAWPSAGAAVAGDRLHLASRNLDRTRVAEVDLDDLAVVRQRTIAEGDGAWGMTATAAGVYVGVFGARGRPNLFLLGPSGSRAVATLDVDYVWELVAAPDGTVYGVAGPPDLVFRYDPRTDRAEAVPILTPGQGPRTCCLVGGRLVVGGARAGRAFLVDRPLGGGPVRDLLPPALRDDEIVYSSAATADDHVVVGTAGARQRRPGLAVIRPDRVAEAYVARLPREALVDRITLTDPFTIWATARPSGALYRLDRPTARLSRQAVPVPMSETRVLAPRGGAVVGSSADGSAWRHDPAAGTTTVADPDALGLVGRPQRPQSIGASARHVVVGGSFSVTRHDLAAGTRTTRFVPGEPKAMVEVGDTTYMAIYPIGELWRWDADADEPRRLTQLDPGQVRPIALDHLAQLDALLCTTTDDKQRSVLQTVDPVTGRVDVLANPLGGQVVAGVTSAGQTTYVGGSGASPSVAAIDAVSGAQIWRVDGVVPNGSFVLGLQVVGTRLAVTTVTGWFTTIDLASAAVAPPVRVADQAGQLRRLRDDLVLTTGNALWRLDPRNRSFRAIETELDGQFWNWPPMDVGPDGRAWLVRGRDLVHTQPLV